MFIPNANSFQGGGGKIPYVKFTSYPFPSLPKANSFPKAIPNMSGHQQVAGTRNPQIGRQTQP
jgi:hypothetical protein